MSKGLASQQGQFRRSVPLAARMRPDDLDQVVGQGHLVGPGMPIRRQLEEGHLFSMIFWGPPGSGKTTLAMIIAKQTQTEFVRLSAVSSGLSDVRKVLDQARRYKAHYAKRTILFIDEIHRFNKAQQDALLPAVENGEVVLIGSTTENPSYEVIPPLLSRVRTFVLYPLKREELLEVIDRALSQDELLLKKRVVVGPKQRELIAALANGDARQALNILEMAVTIARPDGEGAINLSSDHIRQAAQSRPEFYDKAGDRHYDTVSAFIKSVRGSDPDAALVWMSKMLAAGESPIFIARRLLILASEDIGNADPMGIVVAASAAKAVEIVGMPEAKIILAQAVTYLASAPKSNASYLAVSQAEKVVKEMGDKLTVPLHLRNASFAAAEAFGYGVGYKYPHEYEEHWVEQDYLPEDFSDLVVYHPTDAGFEARIKERLERIRAKSGQKAASRRQGKAGSAEKKRQG